MRVCLYASPWRSLLPSVGSEPLAASAERRAEQSGRLTPSGISQGCATRPAAVITPQEIGPSRTAAKPVFRPPLIYPKSELLSQHSDVILMEAEVTEHGTVVRPKHKSPADASDDFTLSSQLALQLWRFEPAMADGCPARMQATFEFAFQAK